jgi:serine/threonine protein kinase
VRDGIWGTPVYMAPELIRAQKMGQDLNAHPSIDIFSASAVIGLAFNGGYTVIKTRDKLLEKDKTNISQFDNYGFNFEKVKNKEVKDFLNKMIARHPSQRPTAEEGFKFFAEAYAKACPKEYGIPALKSELEKLVGDLSTEVKRYEGFDHIDSAKTRVQSIAPSKYRQKISTAQQKQQRFQAMKDEVEQLLKIMSHDQDVKYPMYVQAAQKIVDNYLKDPVLNAHRSRGSSGKPNSRKQLDRFKHYLEAHTSNYYFKHLQQFSPAPAQVIKRSRSVPELKNQALPTIKRTQSDPDVAKSSSKAARRH